MDEAQTPHASAPPEAVSSTPPAPSPVLPSTDENQQPRETWRGVRSLLRSPVGVTGALLILIVVVAAVFGDYLAPHDATQANFRARYLPPAWQTGGDTTYLLGTDQLGRDILSRIIVGSRVSVIVGLATVLVAGTFGVLIGLVSGFLGGWIDLILMRIVDASLAIPYIVLVVAVSGVVGPGLLTLVVILSLLNWQAYARVVRGEVLSARELDYVLAARVIGQRRSTIMLRHILPNVTASVIVLGTLQVAITILAESSLSFLGLGVQPPDITWGLVAADGRNVIGSAWWISTMPGIAITLAVLGIIFLGDWLRDALDPRLQA